VAFFFPVSSEVKATQYKINKIKLSISMVAVTPATESTKASFSPRGDAQTVRSLWPMFDLLALTSKFACRLLPNLVEG
jgi:hypothetical protein